MLVRALGVCVCVCVSEARRATWQQPPPLHLTARTQTLCIRCTAHSQKNQAAARLFCNAAICHHQGINEAVWEGKKEGNHFGVGSSSDTSISTGGFRSWLPPSHLSRRIRAEITWIVDLTRACWINSGTTGSAAAFSFFFSFFFFAFELISLVSENATCVWCFSLWLKAGTGTGKSCQNNVDVIIFEVFFNQKIRTTATPLKHMNAQSLPRRSCWQNGRCVSLSFFYMSHSALCVLCANITECCNKLRQLCSLCYRVC